MPTLRSYIYGFVLSVALTLMPFLLIWLHKFTQHRFPTHPELHAAYVALAVLQLGVQLIFFLHIGSESKTHWRKAALGFALFIIVVVVGGTLWIMNNLDEHAMQSSPFTNNQINVHNEQD